MTDASKNWEKGRQYEIYLIVFSDGLISRWIDGVLDLRETEKRRADSSID